MRVLVTGATGFLGQHLVQALLDKNYQVSILARRTSDLSCFKDSPIKVFYGDINDTLPLLEATRDQEQVFHLAGLIAYKKSARPQMIKVNVHGTQNVMDACITNNVSKVLHLSSVTAIGANESPESLDETSPYTLG